MDIVKEDRFPMAGSFTQSNISGDNGPEYLVFEVSLDFLGDLMREIIPAIEHGEENSFDLQFWVEGLLNQAYRLEKLAQPLQGIVFALERNDHRVSSRQ
jgi:hypothetical protein